MQTGEGASDCGVARAGVGGAGEWGRGGVDGEQADFMERGGELGGSTGRLAMERDAEVEGEGVVGVAGPGGAGLEGEGALVEVGGEGGCVCGGAEVAFRREQGEEREGERCCREDRKAGGGGEGEPVR